MLNPENWSRVSILKYYKSCLTCSGSFLFRWLQSTNRPLAQLWPGNEVRGTAGENRLRCMCFSFELSFFFCLGMSFSDHCCVPRFSNRGRASPSLFSHGFHGQVSSGSAGYLPSSSGWLVALPRPEQHGRMHWARPPWEKFSLSCSCLRACGLFHHQFFETKWGKTLPESMCSAIGVFFSPASVPSQSESTKHVHVGKAICLSPSSSAPNAEATHYRKLAESKGKRLQCRQSLCQEAFFFFRLHLEKHRRCTRNAVCMRDDDWEILGVQEARLSWTANDCVLFFSQVLFQTSDAPTWVSRVQIKTRRIALWTVRETPEVCGMRRVLWEVTMYGHLPLTKLGFLSVQLWPIFLLKYSLRRAMLQHEFRWSKPDEKHPKQTKTETRKTAFRS